MVSQMRLKDWQTHFSEFISERRKHRFSWGKNDCCLFAADSTLAVTGKDFASDYRGTYNDEASASTLIQSFGSLENLCTALTGIQPVSAAYADIADVVLASYAGRELLAIANGVHVLAVSGEGLINLPLSVCTKTWKI